MTAVSMTTQALTRRKQLPFGEGRFTGSSTLPGTRSFVGGTADPTGLTHLGAREYDPALGRFISVDPVIDLDDPLQMNAYAYANSRPVTASDPDGQMFWDGFWTYANKAAKAGKKLVRQTPHVFKKAKRPLISYTKKWNTYSPSVYYAKQTSSIQGKSVKAKATEKANATERKKKQEKQKKKDGGIWGKLKGGTSKLWNHANKEITWHKAVDIGIGFAAAAGTAFCIASVACGVGLFAVGAAALFTAGLGAHMAVSTDEEKKQGASQYLKRTAKAEVQGIVSGALCGRGPGGCVAFGPKAGTPLAGVARTQLPREAAKIIGRTIRKYAF
ncbi:RHS repeat-associated core domain-containing protein (plasmid) [Streptomyces sp. NBC_01335]|uniref:RHS repeat-associated core domain-containing protein n=1 Tax=Streptomyces sp. NBC_01335 TaxID=2903828 RepID=UPI002E11B7CC|nr:RHS repeat-associated core domain-containing protein [Streptomyces sp. NBC_01335]